MLGKRVLSVGERDDVGLRGWVEEGEAWSLHAEILGRVLLRSCTCMAVGSSVAGRTLWALVGGVLVSGRLHLGGTWAVARGMTRATGLLFLLSLR